MSYLLYKDTYEFAKVVNKDHLIKENPNNIVSL